MRLPRVRAAARSVASPARTATLGATCLTAGSPVPDPREARCRARPARQVLVRVYAHRYTACRGARQCECLRGGGPSADQGGGARGSQQGVAPPAGATDTPPPGAPAAGYGALGRGPTRMPLDRRIRPSTAARTPSDRDGDGPSRRPRRGRDRRAASHRDERRGGDLSVGSGRRAAEGDALRREGGVGGRKGVWRPRHRARPTVPQRSLSAGARLQGPALRADGLRRPHLRPEPARGLQPDWGRPARPADPARPETDAGLRRDHPVAAGRAAPWGTIAYLLNGPDRCAGGRPGPCCSEARPLLGVPATRPLPAGRDVLARACSLVPDAPTAASPRSHPDGCVGRDIPARIGGDRLGRHRMATHAWR